MRLSDIQSIGVLGAGQMGHGIAQVMAQYFPVKVYDTLPQALERAESAIRKNLTQSVIKNKITDEEKEGVLHRITYHSELEALADADIIIEAVVEKEEVKSSLFQALDRLLKPSAILASNTSSISITRLAAATQRSNQVIGMHFMNPVPVMKLVEIIRSMQTNDDTYELIHDLTTQINKIPVLSQDFPGFISNRVLMPLLNEAMFALYEGVASAEEIDTVFKLGMNHPMGPLALADFIGLDTVLSILNVLYTGFKDARFRPCPLLQRYVDAGYLGRKTSRGFFTYPQTEKQE